jgi:hypothetical protein
MTRQRVRAARKPPPHPAILGRDPPVLSSGNADSGPT